MSCDTHLCKPLTPRDRSTLMGLCFDNVSNYPNAWELEAEFLEAFVQQIDSLSFRYGRAGIWEFPIYTHAQLWDVISVLQESSQTLSKSLVRQRLQGIGVTHQATKEQLDSVIDCGLRVWLMVNFRSPGDSVYDSRRPCVEWLDDMTLKAQIQLLLGKPPTETSSIKRRLSPRFNMAYMKETCGLQVYWTDCIAEHLRLDRRRKVLSIFSRKHILLGRTVTYLSAGMRGNSSAGQQSAKSLLPSDLYEETIQTLDLLFPSTDDRTRRFLKGIGKNFHLVHPQPSSRDLRDYPYWNDRLSELYEEIFLGDPEGWTQLWKDRRDLQKFWTFWVAICLLFLGIVTTIASIVQTWAALRSIDSDRIAELLQVLRDISKEAH